MLQLSPGICSGGFVVDDRRDTFNREQPPTVAIMLPVCVGRRRIIDLRRHAVCLHGPILRRSIRRVSNPSSTAAESLIPDRYNLRHFLRHINDKRHSLHVHSKAMSSSLKT